MRGQIGWVRTALCGVLLASVLLLPACGGGGGGGGAPVVQAPKCVQLSTNTTVVNEEKTFKNPFAGLPSQDLQNALGQTGIVADGVFSNIYVWPDPAHESWDQHLAALGASAVQSETSETLDRFTCDLANSSYFDALTQYGIAPPVYAGDEATLQSCVDAAVQDAAAHNGVIQYLAIKDLINCEQSATGPKTTQVNLFFSPDLKVADANVVDPHTMCITTSGEHESAYHGSFPGTRNFTVIPTGEACNGDISSLTNSLSHEMVETLADPAGAGWLHDTGHGRVTDATDFAKEYNQGELGDICSSVGALPTAAVEWNDPNIQAAPLALAPYWSDADAACVPPAIMNLTLVTDSNNATLPDGHTELITLTTRVHTLDEPISVPPSVGHMQVLALEILITTGAGGLDGNGDPTQDATAAVNNASVVLHPSTGDETTYNINEGNGWASGSLHTAFVAFPLGINVDALPKGFTITTNFVPPDILHTGDTWDITSVTLEAAVAGTQSAPPPSTATPTTAIPTPPTASSGPPQLSVSPAGRTYVNCGTFPIPYPHVTVKNTGGGTLLWQATATNAQVSISPPAGNLGPGESEPLTVSQTSGSGGTDLKFTSPVGSATLSFECKVG